MSAGRDKNGRVGPQWSLWSGCAACQRRRLGRERRPVRSAHPGLWVERLGLERLQGVEAATPPSVEGVVGLSYKVCLQQIR